MSKKLVNYFEETRLWEVYNGAKFKALDYFRAKNNRSPNPSEYSYICILAMICASFGMRKFRIAEEDNVH